MASILRAYKYVECIASSYVSACVNDPLLPWSYFFGGHANFALLQTAMDSAALLRRPMYTQCLTAATLFGAGDVIAQQVVEKRGKEHDVCG